jgi:CheY-like chemotaxis protein
MPPRARPPKPSKTREPPRRRADPRAVELALATLAHEVRTPLNGILAFSELLAVSDLPLRERQWARSVADAAAHIASLTTVVVDGARARGRKLPLREQTFDPAVLAQALSQSLAARAAVSGLASAAEIASGLPPRVSGDAVRLRAAVENLIDNAAKFTGAGEIRLAVTATRLPAGRTRIAFAVADSGVGLSPPQLRRLFRPFSQATNTAGRFGGAGLGLVFARRIARAMGGDLTVESVPNAGSTFTLTVTLARAKDPAGSERGRGSTVRPAARPLRLLCAEDNPHGRIVINTMAIALGHSVAFVDSGEAAVRAAAGGEYDAVLMDVVLPGAGGIVATRALRALPGAAGRTPVIGLSGRGSASEQAARQAGMDAYLVKPIGPAVLAAALAQVTADRKRTAT